MAIWWVSLRCTVLTMRLRSSSGGAGRAGSRWSARRGSGGVLGWPRAARGGAAGPATAATARARAWTWAERSAGDGAPAPPALPPPFSWVSWEEALVDQHAEVKYLSFRGEIDACVFPCLGDRHGC